CGSLAEFEFDPTAIGVTNVGRPVAAVHPESFARFVLLDLDARLVEVREQCRHRLAGVGLVRAQQNTDVFAIHIEVFVGGYEMEMPAARGHRHEREFVALEFLPITHRQSEDIVIEFERGVEVADADGDVVKISGFEIHSAVSIRPVKNHRSREPSQLASNPSGSLAASLTRTAATVSSTSWTRTMSAPRSAATALAATVA